MPVSAEEPPNAKGGRSQAVPPVGRPLITRVGPHTIHSLEYGTGDEVLVLIHGLSGSSRWWIRNIPELASRFRVLVPDLIGFGRSRVVGPLPTIRQVARLLARWVDTLDVEQVTPVGHSMGGQISIHFAAYAPERLKRLVLVDAAGIPRLMSPRALLRFAGEASPLWRWGDPSFLPVIAGDAWTAGPRVLLRALRNIQLDDVRPLLPQIRVPTLIIWGDRDRLVPIADGWELRRLIPDSRIAVLRGAAHNAMVDRPADFNRLLCRFIEGDPVGR